MRILLRDEQGNYQSIDDRATEARETTGSVFDPDLGSLDPLPARVVLSDALGHAGSTPDEDAPSWIASWSQAGWERFDRAYREARDEARAQDTGLVLRPSSTGMLSDAVCTLNWCARGGGQDAELLLDPVGWVVPSMMRDLEDHLDRIAELGLEMIERGRVWGVMLRSVRAGESGGLGACPLREGEPDHGMLVKKLGGLARASGRCVLLDRADLDLVGG